MTTAQDQQSRAEFDRYWLARQRARGYGEALTDEEMLARPHRRDDEFHAWQAARALPEGVEPAGWVDKRSIDWLADLGRGPNSYTQTQIHKTREGVEDGQAIFTAAQVQAMGRVPAEAVAALKEYEAFFDQLFAQACSNGLFDAWGRPINCTRLNKAHHMAERALKAHPTGD